MTVSFHPAAKTESRLRLAFIGPAGSGKTYSALRVASSLSSGRIALLDTERGSASKYAHKFTFDVFEPDLFSPEVYISAIHAAETAGYDVLIIDSLSHAWAGKGGILEFVDQETRRSSSHNAYTDGWRKATPKHNDLVDALLSCSMHLIVTMRSRTDYVLEKDEKGRSVPRRVGLQPVQREGIEFEFDVVGDLTHDNDYIISKTRCEALAGAVINKPGEDLAQTLKIWLADTSSRINLANGKLLTNPNDIQGTQGAPSVATPQARSAESSTSPLKDSTAVSYESLLPELADSQSSAKVISSNQQSATSNQQFTFPRRVPWSPAQLQPAVDANLAPSAAQAAGALNLSTLPEDSSPDSCLAWLQSYAYYRRAGLDPQGAASAANSALSLP